MLGQRERERERVREGPYQGHEPLEYAGHLLRSNYGGDVGVGGGREGGAVKIIDDRHHGSSILLRPAAVRTDAHTYMYTCTYIHT